MRALSAQLNHSTLHIPMEVIICTLDPHCPLLSAFVAAPKCACERLLLNSCSGSLRRTETTGQRLSWPYTMNSTVNVCTSLLLLTCRFWLDHWISAHGDQQLIDRIAATWGRHLSAASLRWNQVQQEGILQPLWQIVTQICLACTLDAGQKQYWMNQSQLAWVEWVKEEPALQRGHWCTILGLWWSHSFDFFMAVDHLNKNVLQY